MSQCPLVPGRSSLPASQSLLSGWVLFLKWPGRKPRAKSRPYLLPGWHGFCGKPCRGPECCHAHRCLGEPPGAVLQRLSPKASGPWT